MLIVEKVWTGEEKLVWVLFLSLQRWKSYLLGRTTIVLSSYTLVRLMLRFLGDKATCETMDNEV